MNLDQIGPTDAMRRALDIQRKAAKPAMIHATLRVEALKLKEPSWHSVSTGRQSIAYAILEPDHVVPTGCIIAEYSWYSKKKNVHGQRYVAMRSANGGYCRDPKMAIDDLLSFWSNDQWEYKFLSFK